MTPGDIIILLLLLTGIAYALRSCLRKQPRKGCPCGGSCGSCGKKCGR